ncbi:PREDICTED: NACHT, LRR and PYD domains-containing protein 3-like [Branchiostoma belcheri]|uniref:NACHT, LRR and PYD domains-containing protein 3-like n=1 Tax=Branchiostoma belcheri TaxID=7741 RepID=A0A6P5ACU2_BRABE|nr:PREDICTED: NACHT, LRR and PYD domains-containing protein 3-like [Branchiostoma belcheri]
MADGQGAAGCSGETAESSSVLLVSGQYATSEDCSSPVSRQVAQTLRGAGWKVYSTVLEDTEEDRKCAEADGVELILPTRSQGDTREPCLDWLTFDHVDRYPNDRLPQDVGWIVGHAGVTSRAAATIKEQRFPQASLSLVTQAIPEDTEKYKEDEKAMGIGEKEDSIRQDAEKADTVFSVGHRAHDHFTISFCAIPDEDKKPAHYLFLPKPSDLFLNTTVKHVKTSQKVVLLIGRVTTDERVKGFDLAAKVLSKVVEKNQDRIKLRICGVSEEEYQASMDILQTSINSGKLIPTLLPHGTQEDVCRDMKQAHLVLMPSRAEPFGLVGLEAMAAGVPVLISDQSGLADLVKKVIPEFHHSVLRITGDDSVDVGRWADQIADVLRMSEAEFRRAAELKKKLLESKYWEESHQQFLQAFGCAGHVSEVQKGKSGATLTGETATDGGSRNPSEPGSPRASSSQLKRKRKRKRQLPVKKKATPSRQSDLFQKSVKRRYELKLTHFKPLIWNDNFTLSLTDIFTQLEMIPTSEKQLKMPRPKDFSWLLSEQGQQRKELKSLDDLFKPDVTGLSTAPRCILIEGEAGGGKTTFLSKEALDAVSQKTELGRRHDIVLLIRLREVREGETIEEMVWDQCVDETTEGIEAQSIRTILQRNKSRVLFLLDGYDELRPEARAVGQAIPKLLSGKMYPNSTIVITSRPSAGVQQYTRPDCHVHIMGFSPKHMVEYVREYFIITKNPEVGEEFIRQYFIMLGADHVFLKNQEPLGSLIQIPMFLMFVCLLWEEDQEIVSTGTMMGLYDNLLTCLVRKCCKREGVDMPTEGLPTEVAESLLQLGKLALEALLRNETLLDLTEVKRQKVNWELLLKLGVVSLEVSSSKLHPRKQLNFSHKTMQEFLAGRYVAHAQVNQDIVELLQLTSISKALELSNLLQFTCGCDSQAAQAVMEELIKLSSKEFSHLRPGDFQEDFHLPVKPNVKTSIETYKRFMLLCLNILNERKELGVLQAVSRALPVIILDLDNRNKQHAALQYYLENIQSSHLPGRMILESSLVDTSEALQGLEQIFTSRVPGLQLDLRLYNVACQFFNFNSPDLTARLVSVLKNVPCLRALDMSGTDLTPSSLQPLVQGFRHMSLLEELDLSENRDLGDAGMEVLQVGLSRVPHLAVLRLRVVSMTAVGMSSLAPYMHHLVGLRELDISYNKIGDTGLESLTTVLHTFTAMQVLGLCATGISPTGMHTLVPALCKLTRLIKLDINDNAIGDPGLECLAAILHHLTAMKVLVLSVTDISDKGISSLIKALPHLVQLQVLDVRWNNIGDSGIVSLVQTLCQPSSLDMEQNPPGDKSLTTLQELHIGGNEGVTGAGLGRVAQVISTLPALTRLDMSGHRDTPAHLSDTAAMDLAEALPRLPALEQLDLCNISMEPAGFQAVVQAAEEHPTMGRLM